MNYNKVAVRPASRPFCGVLTAAACALLLIGCASSPQGGGERDAAPKRVAIDPFSVPNVIPKEEPRSRYGNPASYEVFGKTYNVLDSAEGFRQSGDASWYGTKFHGRRTSSGEPYDMYALTAAHKTLPIPSYVRVTRRDTGQSLIVRVNDRGPFHPGRIIDLSYTAAARLGALEAGAVPVEIVSLTGQTQTLAAPAALDDQWPNAGQRDPAPWPPQPKQAPAASGPEVGAAVLIPTATPPLPAPPAVAKANATEAPDQRTTTDSAGYFLQVGAYRDAANAEQRMAYLRKAGFGTVEIQSSPTRGQPMYRVLVGPFSTRAAVEPDQQKLQSLSIKSLVVTQ